MRSIWKLGLYVEDYIPFISQRFLRINKIFIDKQVKFQNGPGELVALDITPAMLCDPFGEYVSSTKLGREIHNSKRNIKKGIKLKTRIVRVGVKAIKKTSKKMNKKNKNQKKNKKKTKTKVKKK